MGGLINAAWLVLEIIVVMVLDRRTPQVLTQSNRLFGEEQEKVA